MCQEQLMVIAYVLSCTAMLLPWINENQIACSIHNVMVYIGKRMQRGGENNKSEIISGNFKVYFQAVLTLLLGWGWGHFDRTMGEDKLLKILIDLLLLSFLRILGRKEDGRLDRNRFSFSDQSQIYPKVSLLINRTWWRRFVIIWK